MTELKFSSNRKLSRLNWVQVQFQKLSGMAGTVNCELSSSPALAKDLSTHTWTRISFFWLMGNPFQFLQLGRRWRYRCGWLPLWQSRRGQLRCKSICRRFSRQKTNRGYRWEKISQKALECEVLNSRQNYVSSTKADPRVLQLPRLGPHHFYETGRHLLKVCATAEEVETLGDLLVELLRAR